MRTILPVLIVCIVLAGCQRAHKLKNEAEMPYSDNPESIDLERKSPCACVDYSTFINGGLSNDFKKEVLKTAYFLEPTAVQTSLKEHKATASF